MRLHLLTFRLSILFGGALATLVPWRLSTADGTTTVIGVREEDWGMRSRVVAAMAVGLALTSCTSDPGAGHGDVPPALAAELADHLEADFQELAGANGLAPSIPDTRIQGLSVDGGTVTSVLDVNRTIEGDDSEVEVVGLDVKARVVEPGTEEPYCVWLAATSTGMSSGVAVDGRDIDSGCEFQNAGTAFADLRQQDHRYAPTLMQQRPDDEGQTQP